MLEPVDLDTVLVYDKFLRDHDGSTLRILIMCHEDGKKSVSLEKGTELLFDWNNWREHA